MVVLPLKCLIVLFPVVVSLVIPASGVMVGMIRQQEDPASNVVPGSSLLFPDSDEVPECKTDLGSPGRCVDIRLCYAARRAVSSYNHPARCGWINNFVPRVCCHPDQVHYSKTARRPSRNRMTIRRTEMSEDPS